MSTPKVLIVGGGFAGLETAYMLRMRLGEAVNLSLVSDVPAFVFKPNTIYIPFGRDASSFLIPLAPPLHKRRIDLFLGHIAEVDPDRSRVSLTDGTVLPYDFLVLATGATMRPDEIPGMSDHALTIFTIEEMLGLRHRLKGLVQRAASGREEDVLFVVPPNNKCSGPLYEIVLMLETWLRRKGVRDRVHLTYSTYEGSFIQAFGPRLHDVVEREFAARGIAGHTGEVVEKVLDGEVFFAGGVTRPYDHLIAFPPYAAAVHYPQFESDARGFLATDFETRSLKGHPHVYAPGDGGDFPVKQAFLAFLEADAAADDIAAHVDGKGFTRPFDPVSMCVMEMLDTAAFAQVPLELTGDPEHPVRVRPGSEDDYKVGVSPLWRLGKKVLGVYLPMRFRAGEPFHAGTAWQLMDLGLTGMSRILAS